MTPGDWVCYACLDWGSRLFHPDDVHLKAAMLAAGWVSAVAGEDGEFWLLAFGPLRVRLRKELIGGAVVPKPPLVWGETVRVKPPRSERAGTIRCVGWHAEQRRHIFWIAEGGRRIKSRYFSEELESVPEEIKGDAGRSSF